MRRRRRIFVGLLVAVTALAACGDDGEPRAQPSADGTAFVGGSFDELPVPPLAEPLGPERELGDGVVVRSYGVRNRTVEAVMSFYEDALAGQPVIEPVGDAPGDASVLRGEWRYRGRRLRVTVQAAPAADEEPGVEGRVQVSLELHPS
jgi:hypothetical protein